MIRTTPFHERTRRAQRDRPLGALVEPPGGHPLPDVGEVRVLRHPQQRRPVRLVAALQVPHRRTRRRAVPGRRPRARHPDMPAWPRAVHRLVRRPRLRRRGRRRPAPRRATSTCSRPRSRTSRTSRGSSAASTSRIEDVSDDWAVLAVQGPRARDLLAPIARGVAELRLLRPPGDQDRQDRRCASRGPVTRATWATRSGSGARTPLALWDAVWAASRGRGVVPIGMTALYMARIEAGLVLLDVDFQSSRFAWTDAERTTPVELGLGWMLRGLGAPDGAARSSGATPSAASWPTRRRAGS